MVREYVSYMNLKLPTKLCKPVLFSSIEKVILKCCQTGDKFLAKASHIYDEDGDDICSEEIVPGLSVIADVDGMSYPAQVISFQGTYV